MGRQGPPEGPGGSGGVGGCDDPLEAERTSPGGQEMNLAYITAFDWNSATPATWVDYVLIIGVALVCCVVLIVFDHL